MVFFESPPNLMCFFALSEGRVYVLGVVLDGIGQRVEELNFLLGEGSAAVEQVGRSVLHDYNSQIKKCCKGTRTK